jgi:hypothetical protein
MVRLYMMSAMIAERALIRQVFRQCYANHEAFTAKLIPSRRCIPAGCLAACSRSAVRAAASKMGISHNALADVPRAPRRTRPRWRCGSAGCAATVSGEQIGERGRNADVDRNEAYQEFLERCAGFEAEIARESAAGKFTYAELEENDEDLKKLRTWFEKIRKLDFHGASLGDEAGKRLAQCEALLDAYAQQGFDAQDENRPSSRTGKLS